MNTLKRKADKLFSEWVRKEGKCEWCNRTNVRFEAAHIFSRRYLSTRYQPINCLCLCSACHRKAHDQPVEFVEWVKNYLGEDIYVELRYQAKVRIQKGTAGFFTDTIKKITNEEYPYQR